MSKNSYPKSVRNLKFDWPYLIFVNEVLRCFANGVIAVGTNGKLLYGTGWSIIVERSRRNVTLKM